MQKSLFLLLYSLIAFSLGAQSLSQQWATRYNGQGDFTDRFTCTALDNAGNLVAAGYTLRNALGRDILVCQFSPSGSLNWTYTYNGLDNGDDAALSLVIDAANNVYITGYTKGITTNDDAITVKINSNGSQGWLSTYNYTANEDDQGNSITLDKSGNILITGQSDNDPLSSTNNDYITIKYDNAGNQTWVQRHNGLGDDSDKAVKVLTDGTDNVYITGSSYNGVDDDYVTIKYTAAGTQSWVQTVDRGFGDHATDMALDGNYNVYVTGRSNTITFDYYTVKYTSAGGYVWQNIFNNGADDRAIAISTDVNGVSYVTGQVENAITSFYDVATIKINSDGSTGWNALYASAAGKNDIPVDIGLDGSSNVLISANSDGTTPNSSDIVTIKYDNTGSQQWLTPYNGAGNLDDASAALTLDASGNTFVVGFTEDAQNQRNALALKYDPAGVSAWANSYYDGIGDNADNVRAIVADGMGHLYLTGYSFRKGHDRDLLTIKLNAANGDTLWTRTLNGTSSSTDEALGIGIDPSGNIIIGGFSKNSGTSNDFFIAKYNPIGDTLFTRTYNSPQNKSDKAADFALDAAGNVYLTGRSDIGGGIITNYDVLTVKFTNSGNLAWAKTYNSTSINEDKGEKLKIDAAGNIDIAGRIWNGTDFDILLLQYNSAGTQQWFQIISGTGEDKPNGMALDGSNNIYVAGSTTSATGLDFVTAKYNAGGTQSWIKYYNGSTNGADEAEAMVLDYSGNVCVTGYTTTTTGADVYTIKYDAAGNVIWAYPYNNGAADLDDIANAIAIDGGNNILIAVQSDNGSIGNTNNDFLTLAYLPDGTQPTLATYNGTGDSTDVPTVILTSGANVYIGGGSWGPTSQRDMTVVAYAASGLSGIMDELQSGISLYPNPANNQLRIEVPVGNYDLSIVNLLGEVVYGASLTETIHTINVSHISEGIYFVKIQNEIGIYSEKILISH